MEMVTTSTSTSTSTSGRQRLLAIFAAAVVIIGALGLTLTSVDAASSVTPRSGPSGKTVHGTYQGKSQKVPTMLFQVDLNSAPSFMFCIDIGTAIEFGVPYAETGWEESNVKNLAKVARVLSQTNATTTLDPVEIAAAQAAIWHLSDGFDLATNDARNDAAVIARYQALVDDAERNPVSSEPAGTLSVTPAKGSAAYGSPIFYDVATTSTDPIAIELSDSLVNAHPVVDGVCDIATTINTVTGASRFCVTAAGPRSNVKVTLRTAAAPLSAGRVFVRPNRQKHHRKAGYRPGEPDRRCVVDRQRPTHRRHRVPDRRRQLRPACDVDGERVRSRRRRHHLSVDRQWSAGRGRDRGDLHPHPAAR